MFVQDFFMKDAMFFRFNQYKELQDLFCGSDVLCILKQQRTLTMPKGFHTTDAK
jgi:hypothetical protein